MSETEAVRLTATLDIPAGWGSWDVDLHVGCYLLSGGDGGDDTSDRALEGRFRRDGTSGIEAGYASTTMRLGERQDFSQRAHEEGRTPTGTITYVWTTAVAAGGSLKWRFTQAFLSATAYRTS